MKTQMKKASIFMMMIFLTGLFTTADAQRGRGQGYAGNCLASISGLTDKQETEIENMRKAHFEEMDELRTDRRAAISWEKKGEIGITMMEKRLEHLKAVREVLNEEQKEEFDEYLNSRPRSGFGYGPGYNRGKGHGKGKGRGRGPGNGQRW